MAQLFRFPGIERTSLPFRAELVRLAARLRLDPNGLAAVMSRESGFDPGNWNDLCERRAARGLGSLDSCAVGLIQFMPDTARRLGTTVRELSKMADWEQLAFVEKFYRPHAGRLHSPGDFAMATFNPAHIGKPAEFVLYLDGDKGYEQNRGLDLDKDGAIRVGDVTAGIEATYAAAALRVPLEVDETIPLPLAVPAPAEAAAVASCSSLPSAPPASSFSDEVDTVPDTERPKP